MSVIRLYSLERFFVGESLELLAEEVRYLKTVRRGRGEVRLFNAWGQEAKGTLKGSKGFVVERVEQIEREVWPLTVGVALPENAVIAEVIRSVSELGAERLVFFETERTQSFTKRLSLERWQRLAIEAARQSERPRPLEILAVNWRDRDFLETFQSRFFFDEAPHEGGLRIRPDSTAKILALFGSEGGWTAEEREQARELGFTFVHVDLPVLRVATAVTCLSFYLLDRFYLKNP